MERLTALEKLVHEHLNDYALQHLSDQTQGTETHNRIDDALDRVEALENEFATLDEWVEGIEQERENAAILYPGDDYNANPYPGDIMPGDIVDMIGSHPVPPTKEDIEVFLDIFNVEKRSRLSGGRRSLEDLRREGIADSVYNWLKTLV